MNWHKGEQPNRRQWRKVRLKVLDRDGWKCTQCTKAGRLEVDHIKPLENGGAVYALDNLQTLCRSCHIAKHGGTWTIAGSPGVAKVLDKPTTCCIYLGIDYRLVYVI